MRSSIFFLQRLARRVDHPVTHEEETEPVEEVEKSRSTQTPRTNFANVAVATFHPISVPKMIMTDRQHNLITYQILQSDKKCRQMLGISLVFFNQTFACLQGSFLPSDKLTDQDQLTMYFTKLKTGLPMTQVTILFGVHVNTATKFFEAILKSHYKVASDIGLWWLTKEEIEHTLPDSFKNTDYEKTRVIIDASEIRIQCPKAVDAAILCYSSYKSNHTAKFLIGIAPCGLITFMSRAFGGRVTDGHLTNQSGILELLEPQDIVMADKGFPTIELKVLESNSCLVMPPMCRQKRHFSKNQNEEGYRISSLRIHVERAIQRIKRFGVLKFIEWPMLRHLNMILIVLSYCVNNLDPLFAEKKETVPPETDANSNDVTEEDSETAEIDADFNVIDLNDGEHPEDCNCGISDVNIQEMIDELPYFDDE